MSARIPSWAWPLGKLLLAAVILFFVGRQFYDYLQQLDVEHLAIEPVWVAVSALWYFLGMGFAAVYWGRLLRWYGARPAFLPMLRAYYISHLGKYVPGKAWALLLRGTLLPEARFSVAVLTAFYEVLTMMASGALLAALVFIVRPPRDSGMEWNPVYTGLLLLVVVCVPLWPGVFNRVVGRLMAKLQTADAAPPPPLSLVHLLEGLALTGCCWVTFGVSAWAMLCAVLPEPPSFTLGALAHYAATVALSYVAGFLVLVVPSGVGIREYFLLNLLPEPKELVALAVLILRLTWTAAEVIWSALFYLLPRKRT